MPPHGVGLWEALSTEIDKKRNEGDRTYNIAAIEPIVTIVPLLRFAMYGATALDTLRTEKVFSSNALRA